MKLEVLSLKQELGAVEALSIYSTRSGGFLYEENGFQIKPILDEMIPLNCFESCEFLYLTAKIGEVFVSNFKGVLVLIKLHPGKEVNKTIFQLKVKQFCEHHFQVE